MTENLPDIGVKVSPVSTVEAAANALRELILDGNLEPGERLREHDFAERLGIARHSFRAATQILIGEGLLKREPHRGVEVSILAANDVADIFKLREALEIEAVRTVTRAGVVPADAQRAVTEMSALSENAPWRDVVWPDQRFHRAIVDATNSPRLSRAYQGLQSEIVLSLAQLRPVYDAPAEVAAEHEELLEPIIAGNVSQAEALYRNHLAEAAKNLIELHQTRNKEAESKG